MPKVIRLAIELKESTLNDMDEILAEVSQAILLFNDKANSRADAKGGTEYDFDICESPTVSTSAFKTDNSDIGLDEEHGPIALRDMLEEGDWVEIREDFKFTDTTCQKYAGSNGKIISTDLIDGKLSIELLETETMTMVKKSLPVESLKFTCRYNYESDRFSIYNRQT